MKIKKILVIALVLFAIGAVGAFACSHTRDGSDCSSCIYAAKRAEAEAARKQQEACDWLRTKDSESARNTWWDECR